MEIRKNEIVFTQQEVVHILWAQANTSYVSDDNDKEALLEEISTSFAEVRQSDTKDRDIIIQNTPKSREFLARQMLRQETYDIETTTTSKEQDAVLRELHRLGKTATAKMARRVAHNFVSQNSASITNEN